MANGKILTVLQEKGGVGKSIATMNIAYFLSRNSKVLIIDLDGQAADITYYMLGNAIENARKDMLTIMDLFKEKAKLEDVVLPVPDNDNLFIIPANVDVASLSQNDKIRTFKRIIEELRGIYDYIMIDVTPSPTWAHLLSLSSPGQFIVPIISADAASLKALVALNETVQDVLDSINPTAKYLGIIVNRYDSRTNISKEIVSSAENIARQLGTTLFNTKIRQSVALSEQVVSHKSIFEYAPGSSSAKDYEELGKEIILRIESEK